MRLLLSFCLLCGLAGGSLGAQGRPEAVGTRWSFDRGDLRSGEGGKATASLAMRGSPGFVPGRRGLALAIPPGQGSLQIPLAALDASTWTVTMYVRVQVLPRRTRLITWGKAPAGYLDLLADGRLAWGLTSDPELPSSPRSFQRIGNRTWHHVALAVSPEEVTVYLNGVRQGTTPLHSEPLEAPPRLAPPTAGLAPFTGALDELVALPFDASEETLAKVEPYLLLRALVLKDLQDLNLLQQTDELRAPTFEGTARLRAYVHRLFTRQVATSAVLDPLAVAWRGEGIEGYVFSGPTLPEFDPRQSPGNLFLAIRSGQRNGYCGAASLILRSLYKAFGYEPRVRDFIHRNGKDTHVLVEVKILETGDWVFQDPTYDLGGGDFTRATPRFIGIDGLMALSRSPWSSVDFPFREGTYFPEGEEAPAWSFALTGPRFYLGYFHRQARIYPPEVR